MALQKGDKVIVVSGFAGDGYDHGFQKGEIVTYTGENFPPHHRGQWYQFESDTDVGHTQYMLEEHFTRQVVLKPTAVRVSGETVQKDLPTKASYAVFNAADEIVATTADRDYARELKAALGGKRKGIRIFSYVADKEIR
ncbi:hypothetical protein ISREJYDI_CDS0065 [Pseudomonas phage UNO-G1W1]|jgi:hypothetical protein|uniref:Uncharacterized protein n=1 Tax=Pseudomonas phage UNO-G1W1 TaxID=3136609 RepID=A0AAX4MV15_9CAUD